MSGFKVIDQDDQVELFREYAKELITNKENLKSNRFELECAKYFNNVLSKLSKGSTKRDFVSGLLAFETIPDPNSLKSDFVDFIAKLGSSRVEENDDTYLRAFDVIFEKLKFNTRFSESSNVYQRRSTPLENFIYEGYSNNNPSSI